MKQDQPAAPVRGAQWLWWHTPLWARLVAGALGLAAVALTVTGFIGVSLFRQYLIDQSGEQLRNVAAAVEQDRQLKPLYTKTSGLTCGTSPTGTATELINAQGQIASFCAATINEHAYSPELPTQAVLKQAETSNQPMIVTDRTAPFLSWQIVVVPLQYKQLIGPSAPDSEAAAPITPRPQYETANGYVLVATSLTGVESTVSHLVALEIAVDCVVGAALIMLGYATVRAALRPLDDIAEAAAAISAGDLSRRVTAGHSRTELGRLSTALNGMLGQIEAAFSAREEAVAAARGSEQRMRQFVADASHELRTPLTSIRGFAELYRQGAADPSALPDLIRRIEDEAVRMGLLVEDLLMLARLDQQRPVARDRVHLAALAAGAVAGARVREPDRDVSLDVRQRGGAPEPVVIGDETRLRQALDNLLDNALRYTPADTRVSVRVRPGAPAARGAAPDSYLLEVADNGPGLAEHEAKRVFERFYRADPSRSRNGDGGSGLGLAIVAAIAAAHGGTVSVRTGVGHGAEFSIQLPTGGPGF